MKSSIGSVKPFTGWKFTSIAFLYLCMFWTPYILTVQNFARAKSRNMSYLCSISVYFLFLFVSQRACCATTISKPSMRVSSALLITNIGHKL